MDIVSIVLGVIALATAFTPLIWLQVIGGFVGIAGIALAWRAKNSLASNIALFFMTR